MFPNQEEKTVRVVWVLKKKAAEDDVLIFSAKGQTETYNSHDFLTTVLPSA